MNTCEQHDDAVIVFKYKCPACELEEEKLELERQLEVAEDTIEDLEAKHYEDHGNRTRFLY